VAVMLHMVILIVALFLFGGSGWEAGKRIRTEGFSRKTVEHLATSLFLLIGMVVVSVVAVNAWSDLLIRPDRKPAVYGVLQEAKINLVFAIMYVLAYAGLGVMAWKRSKRTAT
jgi:hypothetical protein